MLYKGFFTIYMIGIVHKFLSNDAQLLDEYLHSLKFDQ
jgi:hypothetical protein